MTHAEEVRYLTRHLRAALQITGEESLTKLQKRSVGRAITRKMKVRPVDTITTMELVGMIEIARSVYPVGIELLAEALETTR